MAAIGKSKLLAGVAAVVFVALIIPLNCHFASAQTSTAFSPQNTFNIPALNGSVSFGVNGSYSTATLINNTWAFTNLRLNYSQLLRNFNISTQDSNITINSYRTNSASVLARTLQLSYTVRGQGQQTINLGLSQRQTVLSRASWYVTLNNLVNGTNFGRSTFLLEGQRWHFLPDGSIVINGAPGRVTVNYDSSVNAGANLPFWQQHSVAIATVVALVIVVAIIVVIKVKSKEDMADE
jgi:hypothetical protein